MSKLFSNSIG